MFDGLREVASRGIVKEGLWRAGQKIGYRGDLRLDIRELVALFMEHLPDDEIRSLRDSIAKEEVEFTGPIWERRREQHERIKELQDKCGKASHALTIVLAGNVGTRRRFMRNGWNECRTCLMCGTEEEGTLATGLLSRFLFREALWKYEKLNGYAARTFIDPEWYLETRAVVRIRPPRPHAACRPTPVPGLCSGRLSASV
jgi:hypothetical protein